MTYEVVNLYTRYGSCEPIRIRYLEDALFPKYNRHNIEERSPYAALLNQTEWEHRLTQEAETSRSDTTILLFPGGIRWATRKFAWDREMHIWFDPGVPEGSIVLVYPPCPKDLVSILKPLPMPSVWDKLQSTDPF